MREDRFPPLNSVWRSLLFAAKRPLMSSSASVQPAPTGRPQAVLPPHESSHPPFTSQDEGLPCQTPHIRRTGQRKQTGREKSNGEASCSHRLPPLLLIFPSPACGPGAHIRLEPAMPRQIFQCSKGEKSQGKG